MLIRFVPAVVVAAAVAGCGQSPISACEENLKASCAFQNRCCTDGELFDIAFTFFDGYSTSEQQCFDGLKGFCQGGQNDAAALGRLAFNSEAWSTCVAARQVAIDSCDIDAFNAADDDCILKAFDGAVAAGSACAFNDECAGGGQCDIPYDDDGEPTSVNVDTGNIEGVCVGAPSVGDACEDFDDCGAVLFCNDEDVCEAVPGEGDTCNFECTEGFFCGPGFICTALLADGEACTFASDCQSGSCAETCAATPPVVERCNGR